MRIKNREFSIEEITKFAKESIDKTELAKKLGYDYFNGKISNKISEILNILNISSDHFDRNAKSRAKRKYKIVQKNCPVCKKSFAANAGEPREKITCSRSCSNTYFTELRHGEKSNKKRSLSLIKNPNFLNKNNYFNSCIICHKKFKCFSPKAKYCSKQCIPIRLVSFDTRVKISKAVKSRIENGNHKGWASRSKLKPSYPEQYVIDLLCFLELENYTRELKVGKWFIDFANISKKFALEIDGSQHNFPERKVSDLIKDTYLIDNGWVVFRVKWKKISAQFREELIILLKNIFT